jgi:hypothetical protein
MTSFRPFIPRIQGDDSIVGRKVCEGEAPGGLQCGPESLWRIVHDDRGKWIFA